MPHPERLKSIRARMVADISIASAYAFGNDASVDPAKGAVSSGLLLLSPLGLAGTCLLEQLVEINVSPGGRRIMIVDSSITHRALESRPIGAQLEWVVERIDYLAQRVGIGSAAGFSRFLRGQGCVFFDIARSTVLEDDALNTFIENELLDLSKLDRMRFSPGEES
ncbi:Hypothetical predicted protein [Lecanosticta acicola]|uniref:Uncharacterized protein n=1 Tax=Lecanosticta acicola TaxID=111012 RepID=A0AAI8Z4V8_9PEZI|nr:Hypothetical predicted protein [Lecanosticta acicola]